MGVHCITLQYGTPNIITFGHEGQKTKMPDTSSHVSSESDVKPYESVNERQMAS